MVDLGHRAQEIKDDILKQASVNFTVPMALLENFEGRAAHALQSIQAFKTDVLPEGIDLNSLGESLASSSSFQAIFDHLNYDFPPPDHAPSHEERAKMVNDTLLSVGEVVVGLCVEKFDVDEVLARQRWLGIADALKMLLVLVGGSDATDL